MVLLSMQFPPASGYVLCQVQIHLFVWAIHIACINTDVFRPGVVLSC
jgi:hypothetical protein